MQVGLLRPAELTLHCMTPFSPRPPAVLVPFLRQPVPPVSPVSSSDVFRHVHAVTSVRVPARLHKHAFLCPFPQRRQYAIYTVLQLLFSLIISQSPSSWDVHGFFLFLPAPLSFSRGAGVGGDAQRWEQNKAAQAWGQRAKWLGHVQQPSLSDMAGQNLDECGERTGQEEETRAVLETRWQSEAWAGLWGQVCKITG